ncbi:MAG: hypothetical protein JST36_10310 [Bacteroidetes bacterium]|nr:hypothetical protein [Bacteroidota bacterium]
MISIPPAIQVNNEPIYNYTQVSGEAKLLHAEYSFQEYLLKELTPVLIKLPEGRYSIALSNLVVGKTGKLLYYYARDIVPISNQVQTFDRVDLDNMPSSTDLQANKVQSLKISRQLVVQVMQQLRKTLDEVELSPIKSQNGKPVNFLLPDSEVNFSGFITIKNGKVGLEHFSE